MALLSRRLLQMNRNAMNSNIKSYVLLVHQYRQFYSLFFPVFNRKLIERD